GVVTFKRGRNDRSFVSILPYRKDEPVTPVKPPKVASKVKELPKATPTGKPATSKKEAAAPEVAEAVAVAEPAVEKKAAAPKKEKAPKLDDLKIIEGVGPKIETLL